MLVNRYYSVVEVCIGKFRTYVLVHFKRKTISIIVSNDLSESDYREIVRILSSKYKVSGFEVNYCNNFVVNS